MWFGIRTSKGWCCSSVWKEIAFEQIAIIPIIKDVYVILKPVVPLEGLGENEGLVFEIKNNETEEYLSLVTDEDIIDDVFDIYFKLIDENEGDE